MRKALSIGLILAVLSLMAALYGSLSGVVAASPLRAVTDTPTPVTPTNTPVTPVTPTDTPTPVTPTNTPVTPTNTPVTLTGTPVTPTSTPRNTREPPPELTPTPPALLPEAGSSNLDAGIVLAIAVLAMLGLGVIEFAMARRRAA